MVPLPHEAGTGTCGTGIGTGNVGVAGEIQNTSTWSAGVARKLRHRRIPKDTEGTEGTQNPDMYDFTACDGLAVSKFFLVFIEITRVMNLWFECGWFDFVFIQGMQTMVPYGSIKVCYAYHASGRERLCENLPWKSQGQDGAPWSNPGLDTYRKNPSV